MPYTDRLRRFQSLLAGQADLVFFPISADLQYLAGVPRDVPNFGAVLHPGMWLEGLWLTPARGPVLALPRMTAEFGGLAAIADGDVRILGDHDDPTVLARDILAGFDLPAKPRVALGDSARGETAVALQQQLPEATFVSGTKLLHPLRVIKSDAEIETMRRGGEITAAAFADVLAQLKHGMTELDVVSEVDYQLRRHGSLGPSFATALYCSGPEHPLLFGQRERSWPRELHPPVSVLFDFGAIHAGYCYDFGRTVAFGDPPSEQRRVFDLVMASQRAGIEALRVGGVTTSEVDAAARAVIAAAGFGDEFRHRLGHAIGLDVHEPPFLTSGDDTLLQEGMLFTIEPSITRFVGFSARVEDVVVARPGGGEPLTTGFQELHVVD
ncbi:MAG: M24 family metallopeptidase [Anaerolineales bacterium]